MPRGRRDRSNFGKGLGTLEYPSTMPSKRAADRSSLGTHDIARAPAQPALSSCGFTPVGPAHPVRAKDDGDGQVSWLAGQRRSAAFSGPGSQWHMADGSPRTVAGAAGVCRSGEHRSELQSRLRISSAVFGLKEKKSNDD